MRRGNTLIAVFAGNAGNREGQSMFGSRFHESNVVVAMPAVSAKRIAGSGSGDDADLLSATSLPEWVVRALADNGIVRVSEVSAMSDEELLGLRGVGRRSVKLIRSTILSHRRRRKLGLLN